PEGLTAVALDEPRSEPGTESEFKPEAEPEITAIRRPASSAIESFDRFVSPGRFEPVEPAADDTPAMMLYTSGSTGRPKGVVLSHASQWWVVQTRLAATPLGRERPLIAAPLYHMNAMALVLLALASHASTVLLPQFSAARYLRAIGQYRCTWLTAVPPMIAMMLQERELLAQTALDSVRAVRMGSAPVSASLLAAIHRILPNARIINAYGTTEGGPVVFGPHPNGLPTPPMSVGYPHPAVAMRLIRDDDDPAGQGMLALRSPGQMLRYHQRPDIAVPFDKQGYYLTGDVFRRDADGFHYFVGRRDDMFVCGGENIYPGEVERMLETHPAVEQAVVVPVDDEIKGQKPVAFVVLRAGHKTDEAALKTYSLEHAPAYQHPRKVWVVPALPLASTNKVDRALLKQWAAQR
ncbi:MAG: AMP-binding protein, partial [Burkholderiaceae bacterium]|nr:AMP-binding protein [Burkholderiaceae bacterium]